MFMRTLSFALVSAFASQAFAGPININTASAEQLQQELVGVGPVIAQRIVEHRDSHGPFKTVEELSIVKGVGDKTLARNSSDILLK